MKHKVESRNQEILPTYFQIYSGRNSIQEYNKVYVQPNRETGLIGGAGHGKK